MTRLGPALDAQRSFPPLVFLTLAALPTLLPVGAAASPLELDDWLELMDRNGDRVVGAYEGAEAWLLLVSEADADGDGGLRGSELVAYLERSRAEESAERRELFQALDVDGDGRVTRDELPEELEALGAQADGDGNGALTLNELLEAEGLDDTTAAFEQELLGFLESVDADGDGAFSLVDLPPAERAEFAGEFEELDANGDGRVERIELLQLVEEERRGATFEVQGADARMRGVIGPSTPGRVLELVLEHPEVERIVMEDVPGSMDDESNLRAARLVRRQGLSTHVPANGVVASGGTDFFQAGVERTCGRGARFGVHSWGGLGEEGADVPRDDPEHVKYLEYYREMGIPEAFYGYTLEAAPAEGIHWMTAEELERYGMLTRAPAREREPEVEASSEPTEPTELIGGCVLARPRGDVPEKGERDRVTGVDPNGPRPLSKRLKACGIVLAAAPEVPDEFLERVGRAVAEIFSVEEGVDIERREEVLGHLHAYRALLPVPRDERSFERLTESDPAAFDRLRREHSLCDIIMAEVPEGQVMEVVEHLLHTITDVGLHYAFPAEWGLSADSQLHEAMRQAIDRGHFVIDGYDDLRGEDEDVIRRILLQEFAYWFITTAWDLQVPYGPDEAEWTIRRPKELRRLYPEFMQVFERTAGRVLRAPTRATLAELGPTRAEERGR